jgi:hypothetical protein
VADLHQDQEYAAYWAEEVRIASSLHYTTVRAHLNHKRQLPLHVRHSSKDAGGGPCGIHTCGARQATQPWARPMSNTPATAGLSTHRTGEVKKGRPLSTTTVRKVTLHETIRFDSTGGPTARPLWGVVVSPELEARTKGQPPGIVTKAISGGAERSPECRHCEGVPLPTRNPYTRKPAHRLAACEGVVVRANARRSIYPIAGQPQHHRHSSSVRRRLRLPMLPVPSHPGGVRFEVRKVTLRGG